MSDYTYFTLSHRANGYRIVLTQRYLARPDFGHYNYAIYRGRHITRAGWSSGSPPKGRAQLSWLEEILAEHLRHDSED